MRVDCVSRELRLEACLRLHINIDGVCRDCQDVNLLLPVVMDNDL